ncbi:SH3 domain-containing protein [Ulvibacter litoralis]|uniref:Tetratricopeptide repeat-containing protein n=1 Tax=Ulvibacter litoralis TaxID=227084 RepID=A0A1G7DGZ4_9FLAO|nr:SH3 domain-containing protein [Ulvibacter litoralis]GHC43490.1 BatE protein [Ulvibacter litoralis]SDE50777.1 Tetratricopeptide repeat-containing protein [Ulvibacter litoralis]
MKQLLYILLFLVSFSSVAQNSALFEQGKERYKQEKYQDAINSWSKILESGEHSASLYFNLGNANYKLNKIGPSIYYYEKALQLAPLDKEIKTNLAFAENARIDAIEPLPKTIFAKWYASLASVLSYNGWAILAVVFSMLFVVLFLVYYFSTSERRKRLLFVGSLFSALFLIASLVMAFQLSSDALHDKPAIIFAESVQVKSEPSLGGGDAFKLHEGTKVQIIGSEDNWVRIKLVDGKDGWVPTTELKQL